jgi:hypothetical protein
MRLNITSIIILCALITGAVFHIGGWHNSNGSGDELVDVIPNQFIGINLILIK